jgi:hypothetical protein
VIRLDELRRGLDRRAGLRLAVLRAHERHLDLLREARLGERSVLERDTELDRTIEVRAVGREAAGERQDVSDPQRERAVLPRGGLRFRSRSAHGGCRYRGGERDGCDDSGSGESSSSHESPFVTVGGHTLR